MHDIIVDDKTKIRIARGGPLRFSDDYDQRQEMSETELAALFDR